MEYPITGRKGDDIYALCCAGSGAESETDRLADLSETLDRVLLGAFLREHLYHQNPRQFEDFQWKMDVVEPGGSVVGAHWTI